MSNNQVRYADTGGDNNPYALLSILKPPRFLFEARSPTSSDGEDEWTFTNTLTGDFFIKDNGVWDLKYNYGGGSVPGTITGALNVGGGVDVFKDVSGTDLRFRTLSSLDGSVFITESGDDLDLQVPAVSGFLVSASNVGSGIQVYKDQVADEIRFRTLHSTSGDLSIVYNGTTGIDFSLTTTPAIESASNLGIGAHVYAGTVGTDLRFKGLSSSTGKITFAVSSTDIDIGVDLTANDVGLGFVENVALGYASVSPSSTADINAGFIVGSLWSQYGTNQVLWTCTSNTASAATWVKIYDSATPYPVVYAADYSSQYASLYGLTINGAAGVLLNPTYTALIARGSWSINQTNGFGNAGLRRNTATDGLTNNTFLITYAADIIVPTRTAGTREFSLVCYVDSLASPISGSGGNIFTAPTTPSQNNVVSIARSFHYKTSTAGALTFYFAFNYPNFGTEGAFNITVQDITITITQI